MLVIHNGASAPFALGGVFYHLQDHAGCSPRYCHRFIVLKKNTLGSRGNTEIIRTLFFCFEWPQIEEDIARLIAVQESALITISIFVLNHCVEFISLLFVCNCTRSLIGSYDVIFQLSVQTFILAY